MVGVELYDTCRKVQNKLNQPHEQYKDDCYLDQVSSTAITAGAGSSGWDGRGLCCQPDAGLAYRVAHCGGVGDVHHRNL